MTYTQETPDNAGAVNLANLKSMGPEGDQISEMFRLVKLKVEIDLPHGFLKFGLVILHFSFS